MGLGDFWMNLHDSVNRELITCQQGWRHQPLGEKFDRNNQYLLRSWHWEGRALGKRLGLESLGFPADLGPD